MPGSIICGMDGSESAKRAARVARRLCSALELRLVFVHVVEAGSPDEKVSRIAKRLHHLAEGCTELDWGAAWVVEVGHPVDRLVAASEADEVSYMVVGSRGPRASLLGSVAAEVSRRAFCPVVVVPPGAGESRTGDDAHAKIAGGSTHFATGLKVDGV
jgi:nucleotide-binding universal stress UspA family protein